ncbi:MAG: hypothetical protein KDK05_27150 [Candidatus Competibacteraceae bacterium]|nr:hypothetical protein [Candidatus Competibacteraceae bacterium]
MVVDGVIVPQPWMQWRRVATVVAESKAGTYGVTSNILESIFGGGDKDELLHAIGTEWTNDTPLPHYVYGMVTRGGATVTLQARSRAYFEMVHGWRIGLNDLEYASVSKVGTGADLGRSGMLAVGTGFAISEHRQNSVTMQLRPDIAGWQNVDPGETFWAGVQLFFRSEFWENGTIDGGDSASESGYVSGDTRLDLFAVPILTLD